LLNPGQFFSDMAMTKWKFSDQEALNAMTTIHANPAFFAKVMAMKQPLQEVARSRKNTIISTRNPAANTGRLRSHNSFLEMNLRTVSARIADRANGGKLKADHRTASTRYVIWSEFGGAMT
jgi:hypothetical protein